VYGMNFSVTVNACGVYVGRIRVNGSRQSKCESSFGFVI
jgi:hypothetical protein